MQKVLTTTLAVLISVAFATVVFAQASAGDQGSDKMMTGKKGMSSGTMSYSGEVTTMNMAGKMMTVKGEKGDMTFDVSGAKMKGKMKVGDRVSVKYMERDGKMMANSVMSAGDGMMKKGTDKGMGMEQQPGSMMK